MATETFKNPDGTTSYTFRGPNVGGASIDASSEEEARQKLRSMYGDVKYADFGLESTGNIDPATAHYNNEAAAQEARDAGAQVNDSQINHPLAAPQGEVPTHQVTTPDGKTHTVQNGSERDSIYKKAVKTGVLPYSTAAERQQEAAKHSSSTSSTKSSSSSTRPPISQADYQMKPGETPDQYTARIAALRGETPPQNTQGGADITGLPAGTLAPGQSGPEVKALQQWLIKNGYAIPDGATGFYGTQTKAAVAALQQKLGVDPGQYPGYYGPITKSALTGQGGGAGGSVAGATTTSGSSSGSGTTSGQDQGEDTTTSPTSSFIETYKEVTDQLGLSDLKKQASDYAKQYGDLENEMNDAIADVNENPWYSEGVRQKEIQRVQSRYETRLNTLSNQQKLYEALFEEGESQARYLTSGVVDDQNKMLELAQKRIDAENNLDTQVVDVDGQKVLIDQNTGETIRVLGGSGGGSGGSGGGSGRFSNANLNTGAANAGLPLADFQDLDEEDQNYFINSYSTFKTMLSNFQNGKLTAKEMRANIEGSNLSEAIKAVLLQKAGISPTVAGASSSSSGISAGKNYKDFVNEDVMPLLGSGWNILAGLIGL